MVILQRKFPVEEVNMKVREAGDRATLIYLPLEFECRLFISTAD